LVASTSSGWEAAVKSSEEIMEILEAYDLPGGLRAAAALAACDHKTVAHYVGLRDSGRGPNERARREMAIDPFVEKVEEWMDRSRGRTRADVVHDKLRAMGFAGSERTTQRAVAPRRGSPGGPDTAGCSGPRWPSRAVAAVRLGPGTAS
jgi:hypothetical protein